MIEAEYCEHFTFNTIMNRGGYDIIGQGFAAPFEMKSRLEMNRGPTF